MSKVTRRHFLEDSLLAAAMAAAFPASRGFSGEEKSKPGAKTKAGQRLRAAIVGVHGRGNEHINAFLNNPNTEIVYVVDVDENVLHHCAERVGKQQGRTPKAVRDLRVALDDKSVDVVSIATPNHWHSLSAIWAMQAGKDVLRGEAGQP